MLCRPCHQSFLLILAIAAALMAGCPKYNNPWTGELYQRPNGAAQPLGSTYAPMPQILPERKESEFDSFDGEAMSEIEDLEAALNFGK
jgi:hypothetical protein